MGKVASNKLSQGQLEELQALNAMPDADIDYSDIQPTSAEQWRGAEVGWGHGCSPAEPTEGKCPSCLS